MTLRTRLVIAAALVLVVVAGGAVVVVRYQERFLVAQLDEELLAARPFLGRPPLPGPGRPDDPVDAPISRLFVGVVDGDQLHQVVQGRLLDDVPELDAATVAAGVGDGPFTVGSVEGDGRFRAVVLQRQPSDPPVVVALPLDEVDRAVGRLRWTMVGMGGAVTVVLALVLWSVEHLGLRPVRRVTAAADAITRGDRGRRVDGADPRTEAGRLATAFNLMLDERDADEQRLRRFVADASHELRTPLTSLRGYLDLRRQGAFQEPHELDDVLRRIGAESSRMQRLVEDLLLLARLDEDPGLEAEPVDVVRLLGDAASDAQVLHPDRSIVVEAGQEPVIVVGDELRLQQVVGVLVRNALVHTPSSARIRLGARAVDDRVEVEVADTGPGMAADDAAHVFDRFYRGDPSRARATGGSGLGLAIARSIVEAHHGRISLDTAPGEGCRFLVVLPARGLG